MRTDKENIQRADSAPSLDNGAAQDDRPSGTDRKRKRPRNLSRREAIVLRNKGDAEKLDKTPVEIPGQSSLPAPLSLQEEMKRFIRQELSAAAARNDMGTFEEENDFSDPDEADDMLTPYTVIELTPDADGQLNNDLDGLTYEQLANMAEQGLLAPDSATGLESDPPPLPC